MVLDLVNECGSFEAELARCRERCARLLAGCRRLQRTYGGAIADVRRDGLSIRIQFRSLDRSSSFLLRFLSSQEQLASMLTGYLLNVHDIRAAPTPSNPFAVRLEPAACIRGVDIERVLAAMEDVCVRLCGHDALGLTAFWADGVSCRSGELPAMRPEWKFFAYDAASFRRRERRTPTARVAWLFHLIEADDLTVLEPALDSIPIEMRESYADHLSTLANPVVMSAVDIRSSVGDAVRLYPIMLPVTSRWMKHGLDARQPAALRTLVQKGIDVARFLGCDVVSLGQYTSIATRNGTTLTSSDMGLTTGNSYAIALSIQAIHRAHAERESDAGDSVLAVVGAAGNVGRACAEMLAPCFNRTILIGSNRPGSQLRLQRLSRKIPNARITTELAAVGGANTVVIAMNAVDPPLGPHYFAQDAIVCDLSVPTCIRSGTRNTRPDLLIIHGGIVHLPFGEDLEIVGFPLPPGHTYACMAEGILLGLEGARDATFTGWLTPNKIRRIDEIARRHGFELADYKESCVLGSAPREQFHVDAC